MTETFPHLEAPDIERKREQYRENTETIFSAFIQKCTRVCEQQRVQGSFADCIDVQTARAIGYTDSTPGILHVLAEELTEAGIEMPYETIRDGVDTRYAQDGVDAVHEYVQELFIQAVPKEDEDIFSKDVVHSNVWENGDEALQPILTTLGYNASIPFMEVHVISKYQYVGESYGRQVRTDLEHIAEDIVSAHPQVQGVVGTSWLMDTEIAERTFKFHVVGEYERVRDDEAYRKQMIRHDGTIDSALLQDYVAGKPLPHKVRFGHIPVKEFLYWYLPRTLRDTPVTLTTLRPEMSEAYEQIQVERKNFLKCLAPVWDSVVRGEKPVEVIYETLAQHAPNLTRFQDEHGLQDAVHVFLNSVLEARVLFADIDAVKETHPDLYEKWKDFQVHEQNCLEEYAFIKEMFDVRTFVPPTAPRE